LTEVEPRSSTSWCYVADAFFKAASTSTRTHGGAGGALRFSSAYTAIFNCRSPPTAVTEIAALRTDRSPVKISIDFNAAVFEAYGQVVP
jgi:hypothetical protein